ncbi:VPS10 domain-containing protein [Owenweeksia hongkongensis]|uniref:VPS10 domain-containing protein n=1 Tax=Owenweeksia hongkongensis TaxID=253245 RepID=UPI003A95BF6F
MNIPEGFSISKLLATDSITRFHKIQMLHEDTIILWVQVRSGDGILYTHDRGKSWAGRKIKLGRKYYYQTSNMHFLNSQVGVITSHHDPKLLRTEDSGKTWDTIKVPENTGIIDYLQKDQSGNLYAIIRNTSFNNPNLIKSTDQGIKWDTIIENCGWELKIFENKLFVLNDQNLISKFDLQGNLLSSFTFSNPNESAIRDWFIADEQNIMISRGNSTFTTSDGGSTWTRVLDQACQIVDFSTDNKAFVLINRFCLESDYGVDYSTFAYTEDGGETWNKGEEFAGTYLGDKQKLGANKYLTSLGDNLFEITK